LNSPASAMLTRNRSRCPRVPSSYAIFHLSVVVRRVHDQGRTDAILSARGPRDCARCHSAIMLRARGGKAAERWPRGSACAQLCGREVTAFRLLTRSFQELLLRQPSGLHMPTGRRGLWGPCPGSVVWL
jgi:hypothetical protein